MSRYIDADALIEEFDKTFLGNNPRGVIRGTIENAPTADVVEVVWCEDCVHYQPSLFGEKKMCFRKDVDGVQICYDFSPDDFCSYGERREDVTDTKTD